MGTRETREKENVHFLHRSHRPMHRVVDVSRRARRALLVLRGQRSGEIRTYERLFWTDRRERCDFAVLAFHCRHRVGSVVRACPEQGPISRRSQPRPNANSEEVRLAGHVDIDDTTLEVAYRNHRDGAHR